MSSPSSDDERDRLTALRNYDILDTPPDQDFDDLALMAARVCETPMALVSFVDANRQWFKARVGLAVSETAREVSFCSTAIG